MNKLTKTMLASSAALLFAISTNSYSEESGVSGRATAVDKADQVRDANENARERLEDAGENKADRMEDQADQVRESAEDKADRMEDKADEVRDATDY